VSKLKARGCQEIKLICLVSAPPGIERMQKDHPDTLVYTAAVDAGLDARGFIHPGLGDAGDRIFGTA
jgi:uracil phosphoribosyltransferase